MIVDRKLRVKRNVRRFELCGVDALATIAPLSALDNRSRDVSLFFAVCTNKSQPKGEF